MTADHKTESNHIPPARIMPESSGVADERRMAYFEANRSRLTNAERAEFRKIANRQLSKFSGKPFYMISEGGEKIKVEFSNKGFGRKRERGNKHLVDDVLKGHFDMRKVKDLKNILVGLAKNGYRTQKEAGDHPDKNGAVFMHYIKLQERYKGRDIYVGIREIHLRNNNGIYYNVYTLRRKNRE